MFFRTALALLLALPASPAGAAERKLKASKTGAPTFSPTSSPTYLYEEATPPPSVSIVTEKYTIMDGDYKYNYGSRASDVEPITGPCTDCCSFGNNCNSATNECTSNEIDGCYAVGKDFSVEGTSSYYPLSAGISGSDYPFTGYLHQTLLEAGNVEDRGWAIEVEDAVIKVDAQLCPFEFDFSTGVKQERGCLTAAVQGFSYMFIHFGDARPRNIFNRGRKLQSDSECPTISLPLTGGTGLYAGAQGVVYMNECSWTIYISYIPGHPALAALTPPSFTEFVE